MVNISYHPKRNGNKDSFTQTKSDTLAKRSSIYLFSGEEQYSVRKDYNIIFKRQANKINVEEHKQQFDYKTVIILLT